MLLLIDAYNLLHQSDVLHRDRGAQWLEKARQRLVHTLAEHLDPSLAAQTCLVFDARSPPPDRPREFSQASLRLIFAVDYPEADDLLEELIARHPTPKRLAVVSSDHRVQRAAERRGARCFDADVWYAHLVEKGPLLAVPWPPLAAGSESDSPPQEKPEAPLEGAELEAWLALFTEASPRESPPVGRPPPRDVENGSAVEIEPPDGDKPAPGPGLDPDLANPFPEGYGEDLL